MKLHYYSWLYLVMVNFFTAFGQSMESPTPPDSLFYHARRLAFAGKYEESRILLDRLLVRYPTHADAGILKARTFAWQENFTEAVKLIDPIIEGDPLNKEAVFAKIDFEIWRHQFETALDFVNLYLGSTPKSPELLYKKSQLLFLLKRSRDALDQLDLIESVSMLSDEAVKLKTAILSEQKRYVIETVYRLDLYNRVFPNAHYAATALSRKNTWGTVVTRVNYSNRFLRNSFLSEIEAYPKLTKRTYGYLNFGISQGALFPKQRIGLELYSAISNALEISIGTRMLKLPSADKMFLYTGSVAWTHNAYSFTVRPFVVLNRSFRAWSSTFNFKRHCHHSEIGISGNYGISPDERNLQNSTGVTTEYTYGLKSQGIGLFVKKSLSRDFSLKVNYESNYSELAFGSDQFVWINSVQVTTSVKF